MCDGPFFFVLPLFINRFSFWTTFCVYKFYKSLKINNVTKSFGKLLKFFIKIIAQKFAQFKNL